MNIHQAFKSAQRFNQYDIEAEEQIYLQWRRARTTYEYGNFMLLRHNESW